MPTTLDDRYQLHELIGAGAAGRVYRARDLRLGRDVAVKLLRSDALGGDDSRARFEREAHALARVSDPHVLPIFDVSAGADDAYLVTAFCVDGTLAERIAARVLTPPEARELVHDVATGLAAMHGAGIVHRDIKPRNILRLGGRWVIGDLGIARVAGDTSLTQTGAVIGTPEYWAPETARGAAPTPAVDVYGLGCVAFEALTGRPPFRGATPLETGLLHATAATPALPDRVRAQDPALAAVIARMLEKDPVDRPMPHEFAGGPPAPGPSLTRSCTPIHRPARSRNRRWRAPWRIRALLRVAAAPSCGVSCWCAARLRSLRRSSSQGSPDTTPAPGRRRPRSRERRHAPRRRRRSRKPRLRRGCQFRASSAGPSYLQGQSSRRAVWCSPWLDPQLRRRRAGRSRREVRRRPVASRPVRRSVSRSAPAPHRRRPCRRARTRGREGRRRRTTATATGGESTATGRSSPRGIIIVDTDTP